MSIPSTRYVDITSGLAAATAVTQRDLIGRFFSTSNLLPTETDVDFTSAASVGTYFGTATDEFRIAQAYFSYISRTIRSPSRISYARWADTDTAPRVIGATVTATLADFQAVTAGSIEITLGDVTATASGIDLSGEASFTAIATAMQTAIRASVVDGQFDTATVTYDGTTNNFTLVGGIAEAAIVEITAGTLANLLGWGATARFSNGVLTETITQTLANSVQRSNNFGSFAFVPTLSQAQVTEAATWHNTNNLLFIFSTPVLPADQQTLSDAIINFAGTSINYNLASLSTEFPQVLPMADFASINFNARASVSGGMFIQSSSLSPTVTDEATADTLDALRINYYGRTQTGGQQLSFYQRGVLTGSGTSPTNLNVFQNEIWLKDAVGVAILNLLIANRVSANAAGRGLLLTTIRSVIETALLNGTISLGRTLSNQSRVFIAQQTGDDRAADQVQTAGFWLDAQIIEDSPNNFIAEYTLIYARDVVIRSVEGSHQLV